jgi:O-antigen ligase
VKKNNSVELIAITLISILPIAFIVGSAVINFFIVLLDFLFLYELVNKKKISYLDNKYFYSFVFIWIMLLLSLFFSSNPGNSISRAFGFIRFIFFVFSIRYFFNLDVNGLQKKILFSWTLITVIISLDLIYEYIFGANIVGFETPFYGRLVGFMGDQLKIGGLYFGLIAIVISNIYYVLSKEQKINHLNHIIFYLIIFSFLGISFIIGERSNFIKIFFLITFFIFFYERKNYLIKISFILFSIAAFYMLTTLNEGIKNRFWSAFLKPIINNPVTTITNSQYGLLYEVGIKMYNRNKVFGVGLKNFRHEIFKDEYNNAGSNHPHQFHFEILAELGLVGYLSLFCFFLFNLYLSIKNYIRGKNLLNLGGTIFIVCSLLPFLPSGSFFTTFGAALFWLNFAIMLPKDN